MAMPFDVLVLLGLVFNSQKCYMAKKELASTNIKPEMSGGAKRRHPFLVLCPKQTLLCYSNANFAFLIQNQFWDFQCRRH
jgi:hypothetical protein